MAHAISAVPIVPQGRSYVNVAKIFASRVQNTYDIVLAWMTGESELHSGPDIAVSSEDRFAARPRDGMRLDFGALEASVAHFFLLAVADDCNLFVVACGTYKF